MRTIDPPLLTKTERDDASTSTSFRGHDTEMSETNTPPDTPTRSDATNTASTNPALPVVVKSIAVSLCASAVVWLGLGGGLLADGKTSFKAHSTGYPPGATCGDFSAQRTKVAREILTCNQDNWEQDCLAHYSDTLQYVDGPGLTKVFGLKNMKTYLANQFAFSNQWLTVETETCAADTYIATWSLDMDLGTGNLVDMPGISVLKFEGEDVGDASGDQSSSPKSQLVKYHRDYLPDGKIWEQAPVVGPLVKFQRETYMGCMLSDRGCAELLGAPK